MVPRARPGLHPRTIAWLTLLVIVLIVASAAGFVGLRTMVGPGPSISPPQKPMVSLYLNSVGATGADFVVSAIQPSTPPSSLKVNVAAGGIPGSAVNLGAPPGTAALVYVGNATYSVIWSNPSGTGMVTAGDHLVVFYPVGGAAPPPGTTMTFWLIWSDGSTLAAVSWQA